MVCDGAVKDQDQETAAASTASAASVVAASEASPAPVVVVSARPSARPPPHDKRLGVRHPLKHRRFRAGGKMMVEPGGVPPAHAVPEGEEQEEGASEVEEELVDAEVEQALSAETAMRGAEVEVSSAPAAGVQEMEVEVEGGEMEVKDGEMEVSPGPTVAMGALSWRPIRMRRTRSLTLPKGR